MPEDRKPLTGDEDLTESARRLSEALDQPDAKPDPPPFDPSPNPMRDERIRSTIGDGGGLRVSMGWQDFGDDTPIGGIGRKVVGFRRQRFGFGSPPLKGGVFNDDDGCARGCFYPLGCLGIVLLAILVLIVGAILWLDIGGGDDEHLVSGGDIEVSVTASALASPTSEAEASPEASASAAPSASAEPTDTPTPTATATPTPSGPISLMAHSAIDHPPFARVYSNVGASVALACLYGDPDVVVGALIYILFSGAGLGETELSGRFDANGEVMIEVPILNFGPFQWSATRGEAADGSPLEFVGGDSGDVTAAENPDACGS